MSLQCHIWNWAAGLERDSSSGCTSARAIIEAAFLRLAYNLLDIVLQYPSNRIRGSVRVFTSIASFSSSPVSLASSTCADTLRRKALQ
jgi:hypothetical protein